MTNLLAVDLTESPALLTVVSVEGEQVAVLESKRVDIGAAFEDPVAPEASVVDGGTTSATTSPTDSNQETPAPQTSTAPLPPPEQNLAALLKIFSHEWTHSVVLVPGTDYHSLVVKLPFADGNRLTRVVPLEVQDLVPFEVSEFLVTHKTLGSPTELMGRGPYDIHVGLVPRMVVARYMRGCRALGLDPLLISTPASLLGGLHALAKPERFGQTLLLIHDRPPFTYLSFVIDGRVCHDRVLFQPNLNGCQDPRLGVLREVRSSIREVEQRFSTTIPRIALVASDIATKLVESITGKPTEAISSQETIPSASRETLLPALAAYAAPATESHRPFVNYRFGEFAYRFRITDFLRRLRSSLPYVLAATGIAIASLTGVYVYRSFKISSLQSTIAEQIRASVPDLESAPGNEFTKLQDERAELERALKDIGSPSTISPLDALLEISREIPATTTAAISRIKILGNRVQVELSAPDYTAAESLKSSLEKKRSIFCKIKMDSSSTVGNMQKPNQRGFTITLWLCD